MTIRLQDAPADARYDTVWTEVPTQQPQGIERPMLADGKIYVVLVVVLLIWFGLMALVFRTDRRLARLERSLEAGIRTETEPAKRAP